MLTTSAIRLLFLAGASILCGACAAAVDADAAANDAPIVTSTAQALETCPVVAKPSSLTFAAPVGTTQKLRAYLTNTGSTTVKIIGPEIDDPQFELAGIIGPEIPAGATIAVVFAFHPTAKGATAGAARFSCGTASLTIALSGTGS